MMLSRAALRLLGCPVTGSRVLRGSIGPAVTLRLPLPLAGMLFRLRSVLQEVWELYFSGLATCVC